MQPSPGASPTSATRRLTAPIASRPRATFGVLAIAALGIGLVIGGATQTPAQVTALAIATPGPVAALPAATLGGAAALGATATATATATNALTAPMPVAASLLPTANPGTVATPSVRVTDAALTALLAKLRAKSAIPGIAATIIWPDGATWTAHSGFADVGKGQTVTNATPFAVASISKTFLAALVVKLSEEGRFGLDDPVVSYLPSSKVNRAVTIRELLDHTSGLYDFFLNSKIDKALLGCRTCTWTPSQSLSYVGKPYFAPGTAFAYSNTNYVLLGQIVEAVTGQPYASLLRQRFFDPLGLTSTYVQGMEANRGGAVAHSYRFYTRSLSEKPRSLWDGTGIVPFRSLVTAAGSAGAIASSSLDLARWARALYGGQVLGPVGMAQMLKFAGDPTDPAPAAYGLGVEHFTILGRDAVGHGGRLLGARGAIRYLPAEGVAVAVVINTDRGDPAAIIASLLGRVLPALPPPLPTAPLPSAPTPGPVPSASPPIYDIGSSRSMN